MATYLKCLTCEDEPEFDSPESAMEHKRTVHPDAPKEGTQKGVMFLDGSDFYRNTFELTFGDLKFLMVDSAKRAKDDPMRFVSN